MPNSHRNDPYPRSPFHFAASALARVRGALVAAALVASPFGALSAQEVAQLPDEADALVLETQQSAPDAVQAAGDYIADPAFHGGEYIEDAFFANQTGANNYFLGRKAVRLPNGDILAAALVKNPNGTQTNGLWNIGLVKYDAAGSVRKTWFNAGPYGHAGSEYIVYPKTNAANFSWIQDVKVIGNFILVSTNYNFGGSATDVDTYIVVFDLDGVFRSSTAVFNHGTDAEYIGGMEVYSTGIAGDTRNVVLVGTRVTGASVPRPVFQRFTLNADGTLSDQTGVVALNVAACSSTSDACEAKGIALGAGPLATTGAPPIFVANVRRAGGTSAEANIAVMKINGNGVADANWTNKAWNTSPGGNRADIPFGIAVRTTGLGIPTNPLVHTAYVGSYIDRACTPGISVLRTSTSDNGDTATATNFGGSDATGATCTLIRPAADHGNALTMQEGKLAIVGFRSTPVFCATPPCGEDAVDATLAVLDGLSLKSFVSYPYPVHGPRGRHSGFWGIVGTGNGALVAVGDNRFRNSSDVAANLRGKQSVALLGLAPDDVIFTDGFD